MATLKFIIRNPKKTTNLHIRLIHGTEIDLWCSTKIPVDPKFWDNKKQKLKPLPYPEISLKVNSQLQRLKSELLLLFTRDFLTKKTIDSNWLKNQIASILYKPELYQSGRAKPQNDYLTPFMTWWMDNKASSYIGKHSRKKIGKRSLDHYRSFITKFQYYEKSYGRKKFTQLNITLAEEFRTYLLEEKNYAVGTVNRNLTRLNFFISRARESGIEIPQSFKTVSIIDEEKEKVLEPYFNQEELTKILNYDFSDQPHLDIARDHLIIGCYTGLRVSDFLKNLSLINFKEEYISIQTQKTSTRVTLPISIEIRSVLEKRNGALPPKISEVTLNRHLKTLAKQIGFNEELYGRKFNPETKRKEFGHFPKYELISSHIARRSFATNHYGKIPNIVLMKLGGWKSEKVMLNYIKATGKEFADQLKSYWENRK